MEAIATLHRMLQNSAELTQIEATILITGLPSIFRAQPCCQASTFCRTSPGTSLRPMALAFAGFPHFLHDTGVAELG